MAKKLLGLLDKDQKVNVFLLLIMMIFGALLETGVVSLVMPLVSIIMNPGMIQNNIYLNKVYSFLGCTSDNQFLVFIICLLIDRKSVV